MRPRTARYANTQIVPEGSSAMPLTLSGVPTYDQRHKHSCELSIRDTLSRQHGTDSRNEAPEQGKMHVAVWYLSSGLHRSCSSTSCPCLFGSCTTCLEQGVCRSLLRSVQRSERPEAKQCGLRNLQSQCALSWQLACHSQASMRSASEGRAAIMLDNLSAHDHDQQTNCRAVFSLGTLLQSVCFCILKASSGLRKRHT